MIDLKYQLVYNTLLHILLTGGTPSVDYISGETGLGKGVVEEALEYIGVSLPDLAALDATTVVINAWKRGFDVVGLAISLGWRELEKLCSAVFEEAGYSTERNLHLKHGGRRYEIDLVAWRHSHIIAADCKRWSRMRRSALRRAALSQRERARALAESLQEVKLPLRGGVYTVCPVIIAVYASGREIYGGVPIVSLSELRGFLAEIEGYLGDMRCFKGFRVTLV